MLCSYVCAHFNGVAERLQLGNAGLLGSRETLHDAQAPQNLMHICCKATTTERRPISIHMYVVSLV